jgi:hypothetical protein
MKVKDVGFHILKAGLAFTLYSGLELLSKDKELDGIIKRSKKRKRLINIITLIGLGVIVIREAVSISGDKKHY